MPESDIEPRAWRWAAWGRNGYRAPTASAAGHANIAPVIWTGVALLTPLFTEMLARRYGFDLGRHPPILTAFLLLTSIIVAGALVVLGVNDVDAGTMTVLRVTPVPLNGRHQSHRDGGDHHPRRRDDVVQRDPEPGLVCSLIPPDWWPAWSAACR